MKNETDINLIQGFNLNPIHKVVNLYHREKYSGNVFVENLAQNDTALAHKKQVVQSKYKGMKQMTDITNNEYRENSSRYEMFEALKYNVPVDFLIQHAVTFKLACCDRTDCYKARYDQVQRKNFAGLKSKTK